jgi:hypothetical protein
MVQLPVNYGLSYFCWDLAIFNTSTGVNHTILSQGDRTSLRCRQPNQSKLPLYHFMQLTHAPANQLGSQLRLHDIRFGNQSDRAASGNTGLNAAWFHQPGSLRLGEPITSILGPLDTHASYVLLVTPHSTTSILCHITRLFLNC